MIGWGFVSSIMGNCEDDDSMCTKPADMRMIVEENPIFYTVEYTPRIYVGSVMIREYRKSTCQPTKVQLLRYEQETLNDTAYEFRITSAGGDIKKERKRVINALLALGEII
jgi:hypothetical protein